MVLERYNKTVKPYTAVHRTVKRYADIIIPGGGENLVGIEVLKTKSKNTCVICPQLMRSSRRYIWIVFSSP
jgi:uridine kinase